MTNIRTSSLLSKKTSGRLLIRFFLFVISGVFIGQLISSGIFVFYFENNPDIMNKMVAHPTEYFSYSQELLLFQAIYSFILFLITPILFSIRFHFPIDFSLESTNSRNMNGYFLIGLLMLFALPLSGLMAEWNRLIPLPFDWKESLVAMEKSTEAITQIITHYDSLIEFLIGLFIIGILAAIGEEITFRGIIQPLFQGLFQNIHIGILITAFIFSAIHFQFLSFLPRFVLGTILGYFYHYSKSIWLPIFAHFINNGASLCIVYFYQKNNNSEEIMKHVPLGLAFGCAIITFSLFVLLKRTWTTDSKLTT